MWRAAVTWPTRRFGDVAPAGPVEEERGQFWVKNPFRYPRDLNLSAYEPNRVLLNTGGFRFLDVSHLSGAGCTGDGRGVLVGDVTGDLQPDLVVRHSGGGALRVFANRFPKAGRLVVSLEGTKSNRLGIGARVAVELGNRRLVRQLFPTNNFVAQQAARVRFGLGDAKTVDRLVVHWPSGEVQDFTDVPANLHVRVREGDDELR